MLKRFLRRLLPVPTREQRARRRFFAISLSPDDVAIDCGANVGEITGHLAASGATVHAFEPNPHAFRVLSERFAGAPKVQCIPAGVADRAGRMRLYLHERSDDDEVYWSSGSSLLACKGNVREDRFVEVEIVDLCAFIDSLDRRVRILKLDVEGVECGILRKLIDTGTIGKIDHVFVETHDHKIPELREETDAIRALIARRGITNIDLDWT